MKSFLSKNTSRLAVLAAFFTNGAVMATWVSRIPAIQNKLGLSEGALGLVLLGLSAGALTALSLAGGLIARFGSPRVTLLGALGMCIILPLVALSNHVVLLGVLLFAFGAAMSTMDVAMNEQAVLVERKAGRPLMSSFHAAFSVGGLAGALLGAGMAAMSVLTPLIHFGIVSLVFTGLMLWAFPRLIQVEQSEVQEKAVFRLPERALWTLGMVAFSGAIAEGSMSDWSAVYLTRVLHSDASFAALGYAAFSLTMTLGRALGDALTSAIKPASVVRAGGLAAALGFLAAVLTNNPLVVLAGFALVGVGLANIIPLTFSAAGNKEGVAPGAGIAGVASIGYAGFLAGPPLIGLIAEASSLRVSLFLVMLLTGSLILTGGAISPSKPVR